MQRGESFSCLAVAAILTTLAGVAGAQNLRDSPEALVVGRFSAARPGGSLPPEWKLLVFKKIERHTAYSLVEDGGTVVVKAESDASASGMIREIEIDPRETPILEWRWKVSNILEKGDLRRKEGDDYPARLYITFAFDPSRIGLGERLGYEVERLLYGKYPPLAALNYIWESKAPLGTIAPNPYTDRARMIVVESGPSRIGEWIAEERNVYDDYRKAFGSEPPRISGVAIMTDTDDTAEKATAYYGDIVFRRVTQNR